MNVNKLNECLHEIPQLKLRKLRDANPERVLWEIVIDVQRGDEETLICVKDNWTDDDDSFRTVMDHDEERLIQAIQSLGYSIEFRETDGNGYLIFASSIPYTILSNILEHFVNDSILLKSFGKARRFW